LNEENIKLFHIYLLMHYKINKKTHCFDLIFLSYSVYEKNIKTYLIIFEVFHSECLNLIMLHFHISSSLLFLLKIK